MNDIITNGTEIKQRIISEITNSKQCVNLAMAWFTDRDIAHAIMEAKHRNVAIDIILSSNAQNEDIKQMFRAANISVHAFATGDDRGMMHHKFCLIDNRISINGSYNYSYNASNNNVENIQISDDPVTYRQLFSEFERLKDNIDNNINVSTQTLSNMQQNQPANPVESFSQRLSDLIYSSAQINPEDYKKEGYEKSKATKGDIAIFRTEYNNLEGQIRKLATDDNLSSKKNALASNIKAAFESEEFDLETKKQKELKDIERDHNSEKSQIEGKISEIKQAKSILQSGNPDTGEKGLLKINEEIEKNKLERQDLEKSFVVKKFWTAGTIVCVIFGVIALVYLTVFFASAMHKMFFEEGEIMRLLEEGMNPGKSPLIDPPAIIKIFNQHTLSGVFYSIVLLFILAFTNLKAVSFKKEVPKWANYLCLGLGVIIVDLVASGMVILMTDRIDALLHGQQSTMRFWEVVKRGEFYLILIFGALPLFIAHYLISNIIIAYRESIPHLVDAEKDKKIKFLDIKLTELNTEKERISNKIKETENELKEYNDKILTLEREFNTRQNQVESKYAELLRNKKKHI
jgi:hypothetical protein